MCIRDRYTIFSGELPLFFWLCVPWNAKKPCPIHKARGDKFFFFRKNDKMWKTRLTDAPSGCTMPTTKNRRKEKAVWSSLAAAWWWCRCACPCACACFLARKTAICFPKTPERSLGPRVSLTTAGSHLASRCIIFGKGGWPMKKLYRLFATGHRMCPPGTIR